MIDSPGPPESVEEFADRLDRNLQAENSDYQAKRSHGLFLDRLTVRVAAAKACLTTGLHRPASSAASARCRD